jgi:hypothetical protein
VLTDLLPDLELLSGNRSCAQSSTYIRVATSDLVEETTRYRAKETCGHQYRASGTFGRSSAEGKNAILNRDCEAVVELLVKLTSRGALRRKTPSVIRAYLVEAE